jgi:putative transposase
MARGNNGQKVFLKPGDYDAFLTALGTVRERYRFYLYAYVLMPNHFHLLLEVVKAPTARILQSLLTAYVRGFNLGETTWGMEVERSRKIFEEAEKGAD